MAGGFVLGSMLISAIFHGLAACFLRTSTHERTHFFLLFPSIPSLLLPSHSLVVVCVTEIANDIKQTQAREGEKDEGEKGMCAADCRTRTNRIPPRALHSLP